MPSISLPLDSLTFNSSFVAKVALEACANPGNDELIAVRYNLTSTQVENWRMYLEQSAERLFSENESIPARSPQFDLHTRALEQLDVAIAILQGEELRYAYANPAYRMFAPSLDLIGQRMRDVFPASEKDGVEAGIKNVLRTGQTWNVKHYTTALPGHGEQIWEGAISRIPETAGNTSSVVVWIREITSSVHTEQSLREQISLLRAISENSSDVMFAKDFDGRLQFANPAAVSLLGKSLDEVIGKTDEELLSDQKAARQVMENDRRILASGNAEEVEEFVPTPDGAPRLWLSQKRPLIEKGKIVGLLGVSRDITDRKSSEESVRKAHDALQRVLESITDGLALLDRNWNYTYFSETGAKMLGIRSADLIGRRFWDLFPHAEKLLFGQEYRRAMETGMATHFEEYYPDPLNMWLECHCYPSPDGLSVYFRDITDRRQAQQLAAENGRRINALLEATPVGLAYAEASGRVLVINGEGRRIWGNPPPTESIAEYRNWKGWWADRSERHGQLIDAEDWPMARALRGEHVAAMVAEIEPFDAPGTRRIIVLRSVPIHDEQGLVSGAVTAQTDITETEQIRTAVSERDYRIRQLANKIPQLAWMADQAGAVHWYNDRWYDYTGRTEQEMLGWAWQSLHDPTVLPEVLVNWEQSLKTGTAFEMTFPLLGKDGQYRPFYTLAEPLLDLEGTVVQWFGTCTDVSKLQAIQQDLSKTQHWLQEGLVAGHMVAWEWDFETDEVRYSDNAVHMLGYGPGKYSLACSTIHLDDRADFDNAIKHAIAERGSIDKITRRSRPDNGKQILIRVKGHVLTDEDESPCGMRGILIDVTEQVLREQALEEASKRKDEFLAMLAHELRNPLAPIATAAQMLSIGSADGQRVKKCSEIIARQLGHMTRLIDDLLDVSRVTRGLVELENKPLMIKDVVNNAIEQARPLIEARKHELTLQFDATPAMVVGDHVRLCQVLANLLNNSAKYTPQGGKIWLSVAARESQVRITLSDNGIGIDEKLLPHVFDLFTQATRTPDRAQGGLGLGLALVDSLVKMHGGTVTAHSDGQGRGAQFVVTLPMVNDIHVEHGSSGSVGLSPAERNRLSIMLVDDNVDAVEMLADMLRLQGHSVTTEYSSTAAIATAHRVTNDLYILDIGLPDFDGYELVRQLRNMPHNVAALFVALTGYGQAHDKVLSKSAGFEHHLVKPIDLSHLQAILQSIRK